MYQWRARRRINIGVTFVSRKISDPLFLHVCLFFRSGRIDEKNSNFDVDGTREEVSGTRLFRLIDWHTSVIIVFLMAFFFDLFFPSFLSSFVSNEITMRSMKFEKIKERERINLPLSIRINVCHFFFSVIFRLYAPINSSNEFYSRSNRFFPLEKRKILFSRNQ